MESATTYFTRRAGQERASAAQAASAEARTAHLELAFRLVSVAIKPTVSAGWLDDAAPTRYSQNHQLDELAGPLSNAFPLRSCVEFNKLLEAIDHSQG